MRLIDADALFRAMEETGWYNNADRDEIAEELVLKAPTIEPERKKGKWNFIGDQMFECTECGTCYTQGQFHQMRVRITDSEFPKFCPNCGAKMEAEA